MLRQIEEDETGAAHRLEISFGEHLIGITDNPDDLQIIEAALRLAARTRGEILTRLNKPKNAGDVERVQRVLKRIERESQDEGFRDRRMLTQLFNPDDRKIIEQIYDDWENYRNEKGTGKLDKVFAEKDWVLLREPLKEIRKINHQFMVLAVRCYGEMLADATD